MSICSNFNCNGWTNNKKYRCGKCRSADKTICCCCDREVISSNIAKKIYCTDCKEFNLMNRCRGYQNVPKMICLMCGAPTFNRKNCEGVCSNTYRSLYNGLRNKDINKTKAIIL